MIKNYEFTGGYYGFVMSYFTGNPSPRDLQDDRIKFKIYCAEMHFQRIKDFQKVEEINSTFETRVKWEDEFECLLFHIIGAKDALLVRICDRFKLDIDEDYRADIDKINPKLKETGKVKILKRLNRLRSRKESWFWNLNKIRNHGTHTRLVNIRVYRGIGGAEVDDRITFRVQSNHSLPVLPYLEKCIKNMKELIEDMLNQDPALK